MDEQPPTSPAPSEHEEEHNCAFIMNVIGLEGLQSYELAPGHVLRRADRGEVGTIRQTLAFLGGSSVQNVMLNAYWECRWPHPEGVIEHLPEDQWRYHVVAFEGYNDTFHTLEQAMQIAPVELEVGFTMLHYRVPPPGAPVWNPNRLFHTLDAARWNAHMFFRTVSEPELRDIALLHTSLAEYDSTLINVQQLATHVGNLKGLPHDSPLRFLGYFAVLESLLTHAPKPRDPYDSITRQVRNKITLLDHRWEPALDYRPFGDTSRDKVWTLMYGYRSALAHGSTPEFGGDLGLLGDHSRALNLLRDAVKATIRYALLEPQLLSDLRNC